MNEDQEIVIGNDQADRLRMLARQWGVTITEATRRVLANGEAMKGEKISIIRSVNDSLVAAGLPPMPVSCLLGMTIRDLEQFKDLWVAPVCGRLIAAR